jgi:hypothetical protein
VAGTVMTAHQNKTGKVYSIPEYTRAFFANSELLIKDYTIILLPQL